MMDWGDLVFIAVVVAGAYFFTFEQFVMGALLVILFELTIWGERMTSPFRIGIYCPSCSSTETYYFPDYARDTFCKECGLSFTIGHEPPGVDE